MFTEINLYDNFQFPTSCTTLKLNNQKTQIIASGNYMPQFKIFNIEENSEFLERRMDAEIIDFCFLSKNNRKLAFLRNDKIIEFYMNYSPYFKLRIPEFGGHMDCVSENLYFCTRREFYKVDLQKGTMDLILENEEDISHFAVSRIHGLLSIFAKNGVTFYDTRKNEFVKRQKTGENGAICGDFNRNVHLAFATNNAVNVLDLRSDKCFEEISVDRPSQIKSRKNSWHVSHARGISIYEDMEMMGNMDVQGIQSFDFKDSVLFVGLDTGKVKTYHTGLDFVPQWCTHAENFIKD